MGETLSHPVRDLVTRPAVTIDAEDSLRVAAHRLWEASIGAAVVLSHGTPAGILSERDVVTAVASGADLDQRKVVDFMTRDVLTVGPLDRVLTAAIDMIDREIRHLPVLDAAGRCTGVVSMRELVRPMLLDALEADEP
jgi:CBS domain-containing protein